MKEARHFYKEIRDADQAGLTPPEICRLFGLDPTWWSDVWVAAKIYIQDGGRRFGVKEFIDLCNVQAPPGAERFLPGFVNFTWD